MYEKCKEFDPQNIDMLTAILNEHNPNQVKNLDEKSKNLMRNLEQKRSTLW